MSTTAEHAEHAEHNTIGSTPRRVTEGGALHQAPGAFTAPGPGAGEPLLRLDARIAPAPTVDGPPRRVEQPFPERPGPESPRWQRPMSSRPREPVGQLLSAEGHSDGDGKRPTELAGLREEARQISAISRIVSQATLEALAGVRPATQLKRWMEPEVWAKVAERAQLMAETRKSEGVSRDGTLPAPRTLQIRRIRTEPVRAGVWEVAIVMSDTKRARACALRFEAHRRRWRVVALELG